MGRVNFDKSIHDRKGITEKVELLSGNQAKELKNWIVYNFPVDYSFIKEQETTRTPKNITDYAPLTIDHLSNSIK